jgi:DNA-binding beta-propeller fold protein YncE
MLRTAELPPAPSARAGVGQALSALFAPSVAEAKPGHGGPGAAALSADGATLFAIGERGLLAIDTSNLTLRGRYLPDISLAGLAIGASSGQIYVVNSAAGTILNVDAASGKLLGELGGVQRPIEVLRVGEAKKT